MPNISVLNLPEETHRALRIRAAENGRSTEAEIRAILEAALRPTTRLKIGTALQEFGKRFGGLELDITRDATPVVPPSFE